MGHGRSPEWRWMREVTVEKSRFIRRPSALRRGRNSSPLRSTSRLTGRVLGAPRRWCLVSGCPPWRVLAPCRARAGLRPCAAVAGRNKIAVLGPFRRRRSARCADEEYDADVRRTADHAGPDGRGPGADPHALRRPQATGGGPAAAGPLWLLRHLDRLAPAIQRRPRTPA